MFPESSLLMLDLSFNPLTLNEIFLEKRTEIVVCKHSIKHYHRRQKNIVILRENLDYNCCSDIDCQESLRPD